MRETQTTVLLDPVLDVVSFECNCLSASKTSGVSSHSQVFPFLSTNVRVVMIVYFLNLQEQLMFQSASRFLVPLLFLPPLPLSLCPDFCRIFVLFVLPDLTGSPSR